MFVVAAVTSGYGWASRDCDEEIAALSAMDGAQFVAGSLNLVGSSPVWLDIRSASYRNGIRTFWRARLEGIPVMIERSLGNHPAHVFEIFATVRLRDALRVKDGDAVTLDIPTEIVSVEHASLWGRLVWNIFWRYRERSIYRNGLYTRVLRSRVIRRYAWRSMQ